VISNALSFIYFYYFGLYLSFYFFYNFVLYIFAIRLIKSEQMSILNFDENFLKEKGAFHTAAEIESQPDLWPSVYRGVKEESRELKKFLDAALAESAKIILAGAGTSAYIGLSLHSLFTRKLGKQALAIPTTDLVTHPANYFSGNDTLMLISFARSGNSPESLAAVELADRLCRKVFHLVVTCDRKGNLAMMNTHNPLYVHVLPPESNDQSLAMTGSYSGMLLSGLLFASLSEISSFEKRVQRLHLYGNTIISKYSQSLRQIADMPFKRAVFLGSGPFFGTATESSLKLQELTDGRIICKNESFLGLRHGPKAVIDNETLLFYIFSGDPYVVNYERDLANSMNKGNNPLITIGLSEKPVPGCSTDAFIGLSDSEILGDDELLTVCNILPGQLLGFYKSLGMGLKPDNPSVNGSISRVVENVKIYQFGQQG